jgi:DNA-binding MarR family transcriptional regulator
MADVIVPVGSGYRNAVPQVWNEARPPDVALIELLFFAYRDFVGDADAVLARYEFGRAHHRVLHFVDRNPGMTVAELLGILKITKQSLGRVLRDLVGQGFVRSRPGARDRRQRLLFTTAQGERLAAELSALQAARIGRALAGAGPGAADTVARFLFAMVEPRDRPLVEGLVGSASPAAED